MDLTELDHAISAREDGLPFPIVFPEWHPKAGQEIGLRVWVASGESEKARAVVMERRAELVNRSIAAIAGKEAPQTKTGEDLIKDDLKMVIALTRKWEWYNGLTFNGGTPEKSNEIALALFNKYPFIARQIDIKAAEIDFFTVNL